jgi:hypothetical protein
MPIKLIEQLEDQPRDATEPLNLTLEPQLPQRLRLARGPLKFLR